MTWTARDRVLGVLRNMTTLSSEDRLRVADEVVTAVKLGLAEEARSLAFRDEVAEALEEKGLMDLIRENGAGIFRDEAFLHPATRTPEEQDHFDRHGHDGPCSRPNW